MKERTFLYQQTFYYWRTGHPCEPCCVTCGHLRREQIRRDRSRYTSSAGGFFPVRRFCALASVLRRARKVREVPGRIRAGSRSPGRKAPPWCPLRRPGME